MKYIKDNKKLKIASAIIMILVLCMSIGYAAFSSVLNIGGIGHVKGVRWSIHFIENSLKVLSDETDGLSNITGDDVIKGATINSDLNSIDFELSINPNSKYEFNVDITNDGDYEGTIKTVLLTTKKGLENASSVYENTYTDGSVTYTVTYEDGTPVLVGDTLNKGETKTLKFKVQYIPVSDSAPTKDTDYTFSASIEYTQSSGLSSGDEVDIPYRITYIPNGGVITVTSKYVNKGEKIGALPVPEKGDLAFQGWYSDEALTKRIDESYVPTSNMNLYAKFGGKYVLTIDSENATSSSVSKIYINYGDSIGTFPTISYQGGFKLEGWYTDSNFTNKIDETYHPTSDMTIYAKSMLVETNDTYYLLDGYKFKAYGVDNMLIVNSNISNDTWQNAKDKAEKFMPSYNSRLVTFDDIAKISVSNLKNNTMWWLESVRKQSPTDGCHAYITAKGIYYECSSGTCYYYEQKDTTLLGVRPIIDVTKVSFKSTGGSGTNDDPYVISKR